MKSESCFKLHLHALESRKKVNASGRRGRAADFKVEITVWCRSFCGECCCWESCDVVLVVEVVVIGSVAVRVNLKENDGRWWWRWFGAGGSRGSWRKQSVAAIPQRRPAPKCCYLPETTSMLEQETRTQRRKDPFRKGVSDPQHDSTTIIHIHR